jgi:hypothetical protein
LRCGSELIVLAVETAVAAAADHVECQQAVAAGVQVQAECPAVLRLSYN